MNYVLFDDSAIRTSLLPLTFTRPVACLRLGILTIAEKWERYLNSRISFQTPEYLQNKFPQHHAEDTIFINGALCPTPALVEAIQQLGQGDALCQGELVLAYRVSIECEQQVEAFLHLVQHTWDIYALNGAEIKRDFELLTQDRTSAPIDDEHTRVYGLENIFIEKGAKIRAAILNAEDGPIYIGKNAQVQEGAMIKGPFALCEESHVNMGGKMRGDVTIGPFSKVGGEISNSVIQGYSNKAHDGFLGNSVLGEWCNLGADTNVSNLKNNYAEVEVYSYKDKKPVKTGRQFCGLVMGDHSKSGINAMFNTGTVVGFCSNIFGTSFPPKFVPSFSWGEGEELITYRLDKALETATRVLARRNMELSEYDKELFQYLFENAEL